ncbi:MAG: cytochrome P450 [Acidimicrobiia bacterium]
MTNSSPVQIHPDLDGVQLGALPPMGTHVPDLYDLLAGVRARGGVEPAWFFDGMPCFLITRYEDVRNGFLDTATYSPRATQELLTFPFLGPTFLGYEGEEHTKHRKVVVSAFTKRRTRAYVEGLLVPQAHAIVDTFCEDGEADLMTQFCERYPLAIIGDLLGLPVDDWHTIAGWARALIFGEGGDREQTAARQLEVADEFRRYVRPLLEERRTAPTDDILSQLVHGSIDGKALTEEEILSFMLLLFPAGVDTTWMAIGAMMTAVLGTPGVVEAVRADPSLIPGVVEEALRFGSPTVIQSRMTVRDTEVSGVAIPSGSFALLAIGAANRDPDHFDRPDEFIYDRNPDEHLAFSFGEHYCLGAHLARAEMVAALTVMLDRLPNLRLEEDVRFVGCSVRGPETVRVGFDPSPLSGIGR